MSTRRALRSIVLAVVGLNPAAARLMADEPLDLIPADSLLCWYGQPTEPDTRGNADAAATLATWVNLGSRLVGRPLQGEVLIWLRLLESMGQMTRYPHAIALIDARARPVGKDGRRVDRLKLALVIKTGGDSSPLRRMIQKIVNEQTDAGAAQLRRAKLGDWLFQTLVDRRLPRWAEISWGDIGEHFVVTLGDGVWADVADVALGKAPSIRRDEWYHGVRAGRSEQPSIEILANLQDVRRRLDPFVDGRASEFLSAWKASQIERTHWAIGYEDRGLFCDAGFLRRGRTIRRRFAHPSLGDAKLRKAIPDGARYAIFKVSPRELVPRLVESLITTRNKKTRGNIRAQWKLIQERHGFDAQRDVLDNLGDFIVLHNDPPHPLNIPLTFTMLVPIRSQPERVRAAIDKMCQGWKAALEQAAVNSDEPSIFGLRRDDDGVWTLQIAFIAGPAWTVTERYLITSWSPAALRGYLQRAGRALNE